MLRPTTIVGLTTISSKNITKRGKMSIRQRVWGSKFGQDFSRFFVKLHEDYDELRQVNPRQAGLKRSGIVSLFSA